jgi:hypothetical protein
MIATDWHAKLTEQHEIVRIKAEEATILLSKPDLPLQTASQLYRDVERLAQRFDEIVNLLAEDIDADTRLSEAAEALDDLWACLSVATVNRVLVLRGLDPFGIRDVCGNGYD